jgi:hypothetical protein
MGLWVARRYGVPVDLALRAEDVRFRLTQYGTGGWSYYFFAPGEKPSHPDVLNDGPYKPKASMTCTGLMALAFGHGTYTDNIKKIDPKKVLTADPKVKAGLMALGVFIGDPTGEPDKGPKLDKAGPIYYFLWTLERTGVIYGLKTIGGKEWFRWAAEVILANQGADGGWRGKYELGSADTCFALLCLSRANPAEDLSEKLKVKSVDPGPPPPPPAKLQEMILDKYEGSGIKPKRKKSEPGKGPGGKQSFNTLPASPVAWAPQARDGWLTHDAIRAAALTERRFFLLAAEPSPG